MPKPTIDSTIVFGGSVGSEGKGAIVGYLALEYNWKAAICTFMTNAGHTWVGDDGEKVVVQQLPVALVNREIPKLLIAPGSAITESQLEKELNEFESRYDVARRLKIHPRAMIIEQQDVDYESNGVTHLASTAKGCGAALARKVRREKSVKLARDVAWLKPFLADTTEIVNDLIDNNDSVLVEGSQGFDLDLNHGIEYPYCTSRGTTPAQVLADCGIDPRTIPNVIAVLRTYPIRVGNVEGGSSGPFGGNEITFEEIARRSGTPANVDIREYTTVTKRLRRIFEMDFDRLAYMAKVCRPDMIALTFADYLDYKLAGKNTDDYDLEDLPESVQEFINQVEQATGASVGFLKTGPRNSDLITF